MFEHLLKKNGLREVVEKEVPELNKTAIEFIKGLIKGEGILKRNKKFLYQVCLYMLHDLFIKFVFVFPL
jgi:hypothetical protein